MKNLSINEKIKKSIKFILKKFDKAIIKVEILGKECLYIECNNKNYYIIENFNDKYDGILIIQDGENNFYEFKEVLKSIPQYFNGNGMVFIRYDVGEYDNLEYVENQFMTFMKLNKYREIEEYVLLSQDGEESGLFITASYHIDLLTKENEYEYYTPNFMIKNKFCCGGCSSSGKCESCTKGCCKK